MNDFQAISLKMRKIKRFIIAGGIGTITHFAILIFLTEYGRFSVIFSTTAAFLIASVVSFTLQKFWTFKSHELHAIPHQMLSYISVSIMNVGINALFMYILVHRLDIYYLAAQVLTSGFIAIESYMLYKHFVFQPRKSDIHSL